MALLENTSLDNATNSNRSASNEVSGKQEKKQLKIVKKSSFTETSPMPKELKATVNKNAPEMFDLFNTVITNKGENAEGIQRDGNTIYVNDISQNALHLFTLEAAKLGKTVTYKEEKTVIISD